jgi:hypothetical protein
MCVGMFVFVSVRLTALLLFPGSAHLLRRPLDEFLG